MQEALLQLAKSYEQTANAIHDAIRDCIRQSDGFINTANNNGRKPNMEALVYDSAKGYTESCPIKALRLGQNGVVEVYLGHNDTIYTDKYLRSDRSAEHWLPLKDSQIVFYQTVLSIANTIDEYMA
ncbi:MAG: hypothetical protein IJ255_06650 [Bacteroidales bacterium]|nr:hypothetical protein [Bacteroidales bacterium]